MFDSSGSHKIHSDFKPSMGGIAILLGALIALLMCLSFQEWISLRFFFIAIALMFIIGLRDDILALTPKQKLYSQFLPVLILVFLDRTTLDSTYGLFEDLIFPEWVSLVISLFVIVILTNAYNLVDGLDGLAGTIGVIVLGFYGVWFFSIGNTAVGFIAFCFSGALLAFLFFNWQPSKIFMGDTGALMIGLLISYLTIRFIRTNHDLPVSSAFKFTASVASAVCVMIIPIFDTLRVIILRLRKFQSPFKADKNHLHHQFLNLGMDHARSVISIALISIFFLVIAVLLRKQGDLVILAIVLVVCLTINFTLKILQTKRVNGAENKVH